MKKRLLSLLLAVLMIAGMAGSSLAAKEAFKSKLASTAEVKGVQVPRAGEHPYQPRGKLEFFGDLGEENFEQHFWWEGKNNLTGSDTFQAGHTYTYELVIMPPSVRRTIRISRSASVSVSMYTKSSRSSIPLQ